MADDLTDSVIDDLDEELDPPAPGRRHRFSVSERAAAYWGWAVALVAVIGLVISLTSSHSDKLASIALILASVAFVLQIGFFLIQLWMSTEQDRRTQQTYHETARC